MLVDPAYATLVKSPVRPQKREARYRVERKSRADEDPRKRKRRAYHHNKPGGEQGNSSGELDRYL